MCATEFAELNVSPLSTLGQGNNIGTAGLQCKSLQVKTLICCCFTSKPSYKEKAFCFFKRRVIIK